MANPVPNGTNLKVVLNFVTGTAGIHQNALHFKTTRGDLDLNTYAIAISDHFSQWYANRVTSSQAGGIVSLTVINLDDENFPPGALVRGWTGDNVPALPAQVAIKVLLQNGSIRPRHYGKLFTFGPQVLFMTNGILNNLGRGRVDSFMGIVIPDFVTQPTFGLRWCIRINKRQGGVTLVPVESYSIAPFFSTVRTRRQGVGI